MKMDIKYVVMVVFNVVLVMIQKIEVMSLKDNIKKGQAFIGIDDEKYYFLGFDYDDQILFTNLDLWSDKEQKYLENATMEDKVKRCLDIIDNSNTNGLELKPIEIGSLVRGQAYSKELNQYYDMIGFIVDNNVYVDNELKAKQKGFFAIYHSNCENSVPLIFERNYSEYDNSFKGKHFIAGNDDRVDIEDEIG